MLAQGGRQRDRPAPVDEKWEQIFMNLENQKALLTYIRESSAIVATAIAETDPDFLGLAAQSALYNGVSLGLTTIGSILANMEVIADAAEKKLPTRAYFEGQSPTDVVAPAGP